MVSPSSLIILFFFFFFLHFTIISTLILGILDTAELSIHDTGGSRLSCTVVKPDSCLAQIFVAKFLCIIKLIIITG